MGKSGHQSLRTRGPQCLSHVEEGESDSCALPSDLPGAPGHSPLSPHRETWVFLRLSSLAHTAFPGQFNSPTSPHGPLSALQVLPDPSILGGTRICDSRHQTICHLVCNYFMSPPTSKQVVQSTSESSSWWHRHQVRHVSAERNTLLRTPAWV